jgi:hypothetical protein
MTNHEIIEYNDRIEYHLNGRLHRDNGPAIIYNDGSEYWFQYDRLHNTNGPAIILPFGMKRYYINDKQYSLNDYKLIIFTLYKKII